MKDAMDESDKLQERGARLFDKTLDLSTENDELRVLVEDMLDYIEIREAFGIPPTAEMCKSFARRASELGIEGDL